MANAEAIRVIFPASLGGVSLAPIGIIERHSDPSPTFSLAYIIACTIM
jgi:hypothetical protein